MVGDEYTHVSAYYPNTSAYIVSLPGIQRTVAGLDPQSGTILERTYLSYDGARGSHGPADPRQRHPPRTQIQGGAYAVEELGYDTFGNRTLARRSSSRTRPARGRNIVDLRHGLQPLPRLRDQRAWPDDHHRLEPSLRPARGRDRPERHRNDYTYDVYCRRTRAERLATGWFETSEYVAFGDPDLQRVTVRRPRPPSGASTIASSQYFDGLGRIWREQGSGPDAAIIVRRSFDARGNRASETLALLWRRAQRLHHLRLRRARPPGAADEPRRHDPQLSPMRSIRGSRSGRSIPL